jgi:hypothetical protein
MADQSQAGGAAGLSLAVPIVGQIESNWCWAAVCAALRRFYESKNDGPCVVASTVLQRNTCCSAPDPCNEPYVLTDALKTFGYLQTGGGAGTADPQSIQTELQARRPIGVGIEWPDSDVWHYVLVSGFDAGSSEITFMDPSDKGSNVTMALDVAQTNFAQRGGRWAWTYYTWH